HGRRAAVALEREAALARAAHTAEGARAVPIVRARIVRAQRADAERTSPEEQRDQWPRPSRHGPMVVDGARRARRSRRCMWERRLREADRQARGESIPNRSRDVPRAGFEPA